MVVPDPPVPAPPASPFAVVACCAGFPVSTLPADPAGGDRGAGVVTARQPAALAGIDGGVDASLGPDEAPARLRNVLAQTGADRGERVAGADGPRVAARQPAGQSEASEDGPRDVRLGDRAVVPSDQDGVIESSGRCLGLDDGGVLDPDVPDLLARREVAEQRLVVFAAVDVQVGDRVAVALERRVVPAGAPHADRLPAGAAVPEGAVGRGDPAVAGLVEVEVIVQLVAGAAARRGAAVAPARGRDAVGEGAVVVGGVGHRVGVAVAVEILPDREQLPEGLDLDQAVVVGVVVHRRRRRRRRLRRRVRPEDQRRPQQQHRQPRDDPGRPRRQHARSGGGGVVLTASSSRLRRGAPAARSSALPPCSSRRARRERRASRRRGAR